jgi:Ca2+-binding RTX toxin-like protein
MAHLGSSFTSYATFLENADQVYAVDLTALNNSGVKGSVILATDFSGDVPYLNVSLLAQNLTPDVVHPQHIHGLIDPETGEALDSVTPTLAADADGDGFVELAEGAPLYGAVLVSLVGADGMAPTANQFGTTAFIQNYDLTSDSFLASEDFDLLDLVPATNREIVVHGQEVGPQYGEGTEGEIDGTQDGYVPILPVASGEVRDAGRDEIDLILQLQRGRASEVFEGTDEADTIMGGAGDDTIDGGDGDDMLMGGGDDDMIMGGLGADTIEGGSQDDMLMGGAGADVFVYGSMSEGADTIMDFQDGVDLVDLSGAGDLRGMVTVMDTDEGALVTIGETSILMLDIAAAALSVEDAIL